MSSFCCFQLIDIVDGGREKESNQQRHNMNMDAFFNDFTDDTTSQQRKHSFFQFKEQSAHHAGKLGHCAIIVDQDLYLDGCLMLMSSIGDKSRLLELLSWLSCSL